MAKQFEVDQQTVLKDYGEIVLYQRSDHKTPRWQTRIKINGAEHYIRKSTKTLDFNEALGFATNLVPGEEGEIKNQILRSTIAHLYFESIHPFEDGNGRIGRAISEKALSQGLGRPVLLRLHQGLKKASTLFSRKQSSLINSKSDSINDK